MKTPEEIKRGITGCLKSRIEHSPCGACPYYEGRGLDCVEELGQDAIAFIRQMEAIADEQEQTILDKEAEIERLEELNAEKDATIARLMTVVEDENESNPDH